jgi:hypothetical protein
VHKENTTVCPGCGLVLPDLQINPPDRFHASGECLQLFSNLSCYTVSKQDAGFLHQYAVDAYGAQHAGGKTRDITVYFGLIGLYLALERGFSGKQVQAAHMHLARVRRVWPALKPPARPACLTVMDVLKAPDGPEKDAMIRQWMTAAWENWGDQRQLVRKTAASLLERGQTRGSR